MWCISWSCDLTLDLGRLCKALKCHVSSVGSFGKWECHGLNLLEHVIHGPWDVSEGHVMHLWGHVTCLVMWLGVKWCWLTRALFTFLVHTQQEKLTNLAGCYLFLLLLFYYDDVILNWSMLLLYMLLFSCDTTIIGEIQTIDKPFYLRVSDV